MKAALWATVMFSFLPLHVYYSGEGRNYSLFAFLSLLSFYLLGRAVSKDRFRDWCFLALGLTLALYANYFGLVLVLTQAVLVARGVFLEKKSCSKVTVAHFALAASAAVAAFVPWFLLTFRMTQSIHVGLLEWGLPL